MNVEVWPVRGRGTLVNVPILIAGGKAHCVFFADNASMRLVRIFGNKKGLGRIVSVNVIRDARERALVALADTAPPTERTTFFAFAADVAS